MITIFEAVFGEDVGSDGAEHPNDGTDSCGVAGGTILVRVNDVFNVRAAAPASGSWITTGATVTAVDFSLNVVSTTSAGSMTWDVKRYGSLGDDPNPDSAATALSRCTSGSAYLSGTTVYRSTGIQSVSLNATAVSDAQDRVGTNATTWAVAVRDAAETTGAGTHLVDFSEYTDATATKRPRLQLTWKAVRDPIMCGGLCPGVRL